jgi:hypothetical protein
MEQKKKQLTKSDKSKDLLITELSKPIKREDTKPIKTILNPIIPLSTDIIDITAKYLSEEVNGLDYDMELIKNYQTLCYSYYRDRLERQNLYLKWNEYEPILKSKYKDIDPLSICYVKHVLVF